MRRLYLVRHGATAWSGARYCGRTDLPLSAPGERQVDALAHWLADRLRGPAVYASTALRARSTAARVAEATGGRLVLDERLREQHFGDAEGLTFDEVAAGWPAIASALVRGEFRVDWPRGERWADFAARVVEAWREIADDARASDVIVVSHGGPIRRLLELAVGPGEALRPAVEVGAVVTLVRAGARWRLLGLATPTSTQVHVP